MASVKADDRKVWLRLYEKKQALTQQFPHQIELECQGCFASNIEVNHVEAIFDGS